MVLENQHLLIDRFEIETWNWLYEKKRDLSIPNMNGTFAYPYERTVYDNWNYFT